MEESNVGRCELSDARPCPPRRLLPSPPPPPPSRCEHTRTGSEDEGRRSPSRSARLQILRTQRPQHAATARPRSLRIHLRGPQVLRLLRILLPQPPLDPCPQECAFELSARPCHRRRAAARDGGSDLGAVLQGCRGAHAPTASKDLLAALQVQSHRPRRPHRHVRRRPLTTTHYRSSPLVYRPRHRALLRVCKYLQSDSGGAL